MPDRGPVDRPAPRPGIGDPQGGPRNQPVIADPGPRRPIRPPRAPGPPDPPVIDDPPTDPDDSSPSILPSDRASQRTTPNPKSREVPTSSPEGEVIPVTFGKARQAGDIIYCETDGISKIYIAQSFGWGPCNAIEDEELDNFPASDYGIMVGATRYNVYLGTPDQPLDPILSTFDPKRWFSAYPGLCYVVYVLDLNVEKNQSVNPTNFKITLLGIFSPDHRQDDTLATTYYHENPDLGLVHLFLDQSWGLGADESQMLWDSWDESADDCDLVIATPDDGAPTTAPTVAVDSLHGAILTGTRQWAYTWMYTSGVETVLSSASSELTTVDFAAVNVTGMDLGTDNVAKIRLYRRKKLPNLSWGPWNLVKEIAPKQSTFWDATRDVFKNGTHPPGANDKAQFRIGLKMRTRATMRDWVTTFRTLFTAFVAFNNGKYQCFVDKERDDTGITFDQSNITGNLELLTVGIAEIPSYTQVNFVDQDNGFLNDSRTWPPGIPLASDIMLRLEKRPWVYEMEGCPSGDQASHIASWSFIRGSRPHRIRARTNQRGLLTLPGSIVTFAHSAHNISGVTTLITSCGPVDDTLGFNLTGEIYSVDDYGWIYVPPSPGVDPPPGGPGSPGPDPEPPTPLILRWRAYMTDTIIVPPPE